MTSYNPRTVSFTLPPINQMQFDLADVIGNLAGFLMLISFVPQIYEMICLKKAEGLSISFAVLLFVVSVLYTVYGIMILSWPLILTNVIATLLTLLMLILKIRYDGITLSEIELPDIQLNDLANTYPRIVRF